MRYRKTGFDPETGQVDHSFHSKIINRLVGFPFPPEEWNYLHSLLEVRSLKKGTHLLQQGDKCRALYYIMRGGARFYYVNKAGDEVTFNFLFENNLVVAFTSLFSGLPAEENIILTEDSVVFVLHNFHLQDLLNRHPVWRILLNKVLTKHFLRLSEKEKMLLSRDYDSRYLSLMETRPWLFERVEQQYLASYLGMTPETLSRIKKRIFASSKQAVIKEYVLMH